MSGGAEDLVRRVTQTQLFPAVAPRRLSVGRHAVPAGQSAPLRSQNCKQLAPDSGLRKSSQHIAPSAQGLDSPGLGISQAAPIGAAG